jgi:hypothetical protein
MWQAREVYNRWWKDMVAVEGGIHVATNAAPIENGRLGAMLWGGIDSERLQLNRNKLFPWCPCPT